MATPAYLEALRRVVARKTRPHRHEINESDEKRGDEGLNSSNSSISYPKPPQNRFGLFGRTFSALEAHCPDHVPAMRWTQAVEDGRRFLATWSSRAEALGWTSADLFGLHQPPEELHPTYSRLSRYDAKGLCWLLQGRRVVALSSSSAAIENPTGSITVYRKHNKPALGPLGDSLEDLV